MFSVYHPSTRPLRAGLSTCLILALVLTMLLPSTNSAIVQADTLHSNVLVSDVGILNSLAEPNSSRMVAIGPDGTIYVAYRGLSGVRVAYSTNRGQSFAPSVQISAIDAPVSIAVDASGRVYIAYVTAGQIMFSRSTDDGQTFSTPINVGTSLLGSVDIAVDAPYVYLLLQNGVTLLVNDNNGVGSFTARSTGLPALAYSSVLVDPESRDLFVTGDNTQLYYVRSTDHGATWDSVVNPSGSVLLSTYSGGFGFIGRQVYIAGIGTTAFLINLETGVSSSRTFGNTLLSGRTLAVDGDGNVIDGYSNGVNVFYAVSTDTGETFDLPVTVATGATRMELAINPMFQDIVAVYEKNGNIYASVFANEIPPTMPVVTKPTADTQTRNATPAFNGTALAGSTVTVAEAMGTPTLCTATADSSGAWSCTPATALSDGNYSVSVTADNVAGSSPPTSLNFGIDATPPAPPVVTNPAAGAQLNTGTPTFSGTTTDADGGTVTIQQGDTVLCTAGISSSTWSCVSMPMSDGDYTLDVIATDAIGNASTPTSRDISIDTAAPAQPTLSSPEEGKPVKANLTLTGSAEPDSTVTVTIDQDGNPATTDDSITFTTTADSAGTWQVDTTSATPTSGDWGAGLSDGMTPSITVTASDAAGNVSSPLYRIPTGVDTTAPAKPDALPDIVYQSRPTFSGETEGNATIQVWIDGNMVCETVADASGAWSCTPTTELDDGEHSARIVVIDEMGNQSSTDSIMTVDTSTRRTNQLFLPLIRR
jgi:hypothetical protein